VFNEAENLPELYQELDHACAGLKRPCEIIFIDDGSTDGSFDVLRSLQAGTPGSRLFGSEELRPDRRIGGWLRLRQGRSS